VAEEKPFFDIPQQIEKNQIQEYLKKTFTKEPIDQDIDEINSELNYKKQNENIDKKKVYDPLSAAKFISPIFGPLIRSAEQQEILAEKVKQQRGEEVNIEDRIIAPKTKEDEIDFFQDIEKGAVGGSAKAVSSVTGWVTAGVDFTFDTSFTNKLDSITRKFLNDHGNPETFVGNVTEIVTQYALPSTIAFKMIQNASALNKLGATARPFLAYKYGETGVKIAKYSGQGALALGAADLIASDPGRETLIFDKINEEGKTGRDLAIARLSNKIRFGAEGALIGAAIPLAGKPLKDITVGALGITAKSIGAAAKVGDVVLTNITNVLAKDPYVIPSISKGISKTADIVGELGTRITLPVVSLGKVSPFVKGLPKFSEWRKYSVQDIEPLKVALGKIDSVLSPFRSFGKFTPEAGRISEDAQLFLKTKQTILNRFLENIERKSYNLAKSFESQYNTAKVSPASQNKYLEDVLDYIQGRIKIDSVQKELRLSAKLLNDELLSTKKIFADLLPEKEIKDILLKDLRGYIKKSFAVITNPNYSVDPNSKTFTDAVGFVKKVINKDRDLVSQSINRFSKLTRDQARTEYAKELVLNMLRIGKINSNDPMKALKEIGKQINFDKVINTGEELPSVIKKLLGEEKNLRASVVNTVSEMYTNIANKQMMDQLADILVQQGYLYKNASAAKINGVLNPIKVSGNGARKIEGIGLLNTKMNDLYGASDKIESLINFKGSTDFIIQSGVNNRILSLLINSYKGALKYFQTVQFGKTVLSPETTALNYASSTFFLLPRGLIGGRASLTESIKMTVDDIFKSGKTAAEKEAKLLESIREGIRYGALDESVVVQQMNQTLKYLQEGKITNQEKLLNFLEKNPGIEFFKKTYQGGDNIFHWYGYNWYKSWFSDFVKKDMNKVKEWYRTVANSDFVEKNLDGGKKTIDEAIKEMSGWMVRNTMPTYSKSPEIVQALKNVPLGTFISFQAEMLRTGFNTISISMREIASKDPVLRSMGLRSLFGMYTVFGGLGYGAKKLYNNLTGFTDEQMEAYRTNFAAGYQKNHDLIPITKMNDEGVFKVIDLSNFNPYSVLQKPVVAALNKSKEADLTNQQGFNYLWSVMFKGKNSVMGELFSSFVATPIGQEKLEEAWSGRTVNGKAIWGELDTPEDKFSKGMAHLITGIEPGVLTTGKKLYYASTGEITPLGQSYDLTDVVLGITTGLKPQEVDLKKLMGFAINNYKSIQSKSLEGTKLYDKDVGGEDAKKEFINIQRKAFYEKKKFYQKIKAYENLKMDTGDVEDSLRRSKESRSKVSEIMDGSFTPLNYSKEKFQKKIDAIQRELDKRGLGNKKSINEDYFFPESELDDIISELEGADLNDIFPYDKKIQKPVTPIIPKPVSSLPQQKIQTPVLPNTPQPVATSNITPQVNPTTKLTSVESALLSPTEQAIRQTQRS
jgi:hypothetical protein